MNKAFNIKEVRKALDKQGDTISKNENTSSRGFSWDILQKDIRIFGNGLPDRVKESFYMELSTLLSAGIDTRTALDMIVREQTKKKYQVVFNSVSQLVVAGNTLSVAMKKNEEFTAYEFQSILIGEETGKLTIILAELAVFFKRKIKQRQQITGALMYPAMVILISFLAVAFMVLYVVPMFADVFKRFGGELPFVTRAVLRFANVVKEYFFLFLLIAGCLLVFCFFNRGKTYFRSWTSRIILRIPVIGAIVRKIYLSRFCSTMALLVGSKIPIVQGIDLIRQMIGYYPIEASLANVEQDVISGMLLHKSLEKHKVYPPKMISLLKAGEEVNKLELFFAQIADQYTTEVEYQTNLLSKFLEPLIIVILGAIVGVILVAMYLPLFKMGQHF